MQDLHFILLNVILLQDAGKKIKQQVNITLNAKMRQSVDGGPIRETRMKKRISSSVIAEESQLPRKNRRLELKESALPRGEVAENACLNKAHDTNLELKSLSHDEGLSVNSTTGTTSVKINKKKEIIVLNSPDSVSLSIYDECLVSLKERQKSLTSELDDTAATSTVKTEATTKEISFVLEDAAAKFHESVEPTKSVCSSPVHEANSFTSNEAQEIKPYIHSSPDVIDGKTENKPANVRSNSVHGEKETELSPCATEGCAVMIYEEVQEKSSDKETSVSEVDEIGPDITCTNDAEKVERNDSARVMNVAEVIHQPNSATKALPERLTIALRSCASRMTTTLQKHVFRYRLLIYLFLIPLESILSSLSHLRLSLCSIYLFVFTECDIP
jgi:hypothetical protein